MTPRIDPVAESPAAGSPAVAPEGSETILDIFLRNARDHPRRLLFTFVDDQGRDGETYDFERFHDTVARLASSLIEERQLRPGERVLLVYPPSLDFITAFMGCLYAGLVPVPMAPPNPFRLRGDLGAFESVATSSGSVAVLTNTAYLRLKRLAAIRNLGVERGTAWRRLPWHRTDRRLGAHLRPHDHQPPDPRRPAFLQYTSGSTSAPRGVMISQANILHQMKAQATGFGLTPQTRSVLWVPHFHDFCLIGGILSGVYGNGHLYLMSPLTFLRKPHVWFDALSRIRATHTAAPDFAFRLSVRKTTPEQRRRWDLSSIRVVASGGEPIRPSTVDAFLEAFAASKLAPESFYPAYGLAENTIGVTRAGGRRITLDRERMEKQGVVHEVEETDPSQALTLIGCGTPFVDVEVRLVDPETRRQVKAGEVGEIWVDSPSKAMGYHGLPEVSQEIFRATIEGAGEGRAYLRTGDLGFRWKGELYVAGRLKDLVIVRGRNIYPQDLEESVYSAHPLIRPGRAVAFSIPATARHKDRGDQETAVVLAEVRSPKVPSQELREICRAVRSRLQRDHRLSPFAIVMLPPGEILKTSSGKLRRRACRQAYLEGAFSERGLRIDVRGGG